jgi:hypothetical protein
LLPKQEADVAQPLLPGPLKSAELLRGPHPPKIKHDGSAKVRRLSGCSAGSWLGMHAPFHRRAGPCQGSTT